MPSVEIPARRWFNRWYIFHVDNMKTEDASTARGKTRAGFSAGSGTRPAPAASRNRKSPEPDFPTRRNAADKTHAAFFPTPFPENIFFKKAASEALPFPETQSTIRTGPPMRNAAYFVLSQPSGPA